MSVLLKDIKLAMLNDRFNDVCLTGTDSTTGCADDGILASRTILSMRSQVFCKMFYGAFKESKESNKIPLSFTTAIIQSIVQYCYSDDAGTKSIADDDTVTETELREMVRLRNAADFFALPELYQIMTDLVTSFTLKHPGMACTVIDELSAVGDGCGMLRDACFGILKFKGEPALLPIDDEQLGRGILACRPLVVAKILSEEVIGQADDLVVRCLQKWKISLAIETGMDGNANTEIVDEMVVLKDVLSADDQEEGVLTANSHKISQAVVREIAGRVRLNLVAPSTLAGSMCAGLFEKEQLYEAYKEHALLAEQKGATVAVRGVSPLANSVLIDGRYCAVEGAGSLEANGVYTKQASLKNCVQWYCKKGKYKNKPATFELLLDDDDNEAKKWWLSAIPADGSGEIDLYYAIADKVNFNKVSKLRWQATDKDDITLEPPPCVRVFA